MIHIQKFLFKGFSLSAETIQKQTRQICEMMKRQLYTKMIVVVSSLTPSSFFDKINKKELEESSVVTFSSSPGNQSQPTKEMITLE